MLSIISSLWHLHLAPVFRQRPHKDPSQWRASVSLFLVSRSGWTDNCSNLCLAESYQPLSASSFLITVKHSTQGFLPSTKRHTAFLSLAARRRCDLAGPFPNRQTQDSHRWSLDEGVGHVYRTTARFKSAELQNVLGVGETSLLYNFTDCLGKNAHCGHWSGQLTRHSPLLVLPLSVANDAWACACVFRLPRFACSSPLFMGMVAFFSLSRTFCNINHPS